jgi:hypothetical protein
MPLNPMTGQFEYGGESYDMPTMGTGMAAGGMEAIGADVPFAFRMMENMPGITAMALFNARRFANTMEKGGYRDILDPNKVKKAGRTQIRRAGQKRRALRVGAFVPDASGNIVQTASDSRFLFGARRGATAAGKTPFVKSSLATNFPRFRNLFRMPTLSHLSGVANAGSYTPFQGMTMLDSMLQKRQFMQDARAGLGVSDDTAMLSGGVLGRLSTMGKNYNSIVGAHRNNMSSANPMRRRAFQRGFKTRAGIRRSLAAMGQPVTPGSTINQKIAMTAGGLLTQGFLDDVAGVLDGDLMAKKIIPASGYSGPSAASQARYRSMFEKAMGGPSSAVDDAMNAINSKTVRQVAGTAFRAGEKKVGLKLAARYVGAQYAKVSGPLNIVGTAATVYDLSKMAATGIVSAGNFAKEAVKSMQGSMRKPLFGMGYQDNEVAATSRSRGVMAIQNSRLNARSMLGSEAGMMAAHFG